MMDEYYLLDDDTSNHIPEEIYDEVSELELRTKKVKKRYKQIYNDYQELMHEKEKETC